MVFLFSCYSLDFDREQIAICVESEGTLTWTLNLKRYLSFEAPSRGNE